VKTTPMVADLPADAISSGNQKREIFMNLRALAIFATSFIKIRKKRKLEACKEFWECRGNGGRHQARLSFR